MLGGDGHPGRTLVTAPSLQEFSTAIQSLMDIKRRDGAGRARINAVFDREENGRADVTLDQP